MLVVLPQLVNDAVVVAVRVYAEWLLSFQHDHDRAVGIEFFEVVAQTPHRLHRRRIRGGHRRRMCFADDFQSRNDDVHENSHKDPGQNDRHREPADHVWDKWPVAALGAPWPLNLDRPGGLGVFGADVALAVQVAHADFTRQKVWALWPSAFFSSRPTPSTVMRQPI